MSYNGWKNYETWNAALWIDNDQGAQEFWAEQAAECLEAHSGDKDDAEQQLATLLEGVFDEDRPDCSGMYADILTAALREIDYLELAAHFIEYAIESERFVPETEETDDDA